MNDTIVINDSYYESEAFEELSPYDPAYPISLLSNSLKDRLRDVDDAVHDIYIKAVQAAPSVAEACHTAFQGSKYVVEMSDTVKQAIDSGAIKLTTNKRGETFAQLVDENGKFGSKLPIHKEDFSQRFNPTVVANSMQMKAMQEQLEEIEAQIQLIDRNVKDVIQGQQNDRIGQYFSGISLFVEAKNLDDSDLKKTLIATSLKSLSDAIFQLKLNMESDIKYLINEEFKHAKGRRVELIDQRMQSINQSFTYIHQATLMKAGIYCEQCELGAMTTVLDEYSHFISDTIAANAPLLAQCDIADKGGEKGVWETRASFRLDTSDLKKQIISKDKVLYLCAQEGLN